MPYQDFFVLPGIALGLIAGSAFHHYNVAASSSAGRVAVVESYAVAVVAFETGGSAAELDKVVCQHSGRHR